MGFDFFIFEGYQLIYYLKKNKLIIYMYILKNIYTYTNHKK